MDTQQLKSLKILLIGESCTDIYHYGECTRLSPEAPVPVFNYKLQKECPGMAANVLQNLESFGVQIDTITNDPAELIKERYIDNRSKCQLLRVDKGTEVFEIHHSNLFLTDLTGYDAVIFSDYDKGLITHSIAKDICNSFQGYIFVDTKKNDLTCFPKAFCKINEYEAEEALALSMGTEMIVTKGKDGAYWNEMHFPAPDVEVYDVSGAGDVFLATFAVSVTAGDPIETSIERAVMMASRSVKHFGTYKITEEDINEICS